MLAISTADADPRTPGSPSRRSPSPGLDALLATRLRALPRAADPGAPLAGRRATVVFEAVPPETSLDRDPPVLDAWTVHIGDGEATVRRGRARRCDTTVRGSAAVLSALVAGSESGIGAFLEHRLAVRGDLALALQLDALFPADAVAPPAHFPRAARVRAAGVATTYLEAGPRDGTPVVLLHGLGATNASMLPLLWDLARDHRVLAPDLPGFGASAAPFAPYSFGWLAHWLTAFQTAVDATPATLIGNSLGGRVALEAALARPSSVRTAVLLCPSPAFRRLRQLVPLVRLLRPEFAAVPVPVTRVLVRETVMAMFSDPSRLPTTWYDAGIDEFLRVWRSPRHRVAFMACLRQIYVEQAHGERGFWSRLTRLDRPALFVWGDRDRLVPAGFARHVTHAVPAGESVVLDDSGHVPQFEHPAVTNRVVRRFLAGQPGS